MQSSTVSTVGRALRRGHWLVWLATLLGLAVALGAASVRPPTYEATALLSIDESADATQGFDTAMQVDQFLSQRFIALATSPAVLQDVCNREGRACSPAALARQVRITTTKAAAQLTVVADAPSAAAAARLANEVAAAVVARNAAFADGLVAARRAYLQDQLNKLDQQIGQTLAQANAAELAGRVGAGPVAELTSQQAQYAATYQRLQDLDVQARQMAGLISVQQPALPPTRPVDPNPLLYLAIGGAGGLLLGLLLALAAELLRGRVHDAAELGEITGTPLVLDLSQRVRPGLSAPGGFLVQAALARRAGGPRALVLVAASPRDRVDDVALALARTAAGEHRRILVTLPSGPSAAAEPEETRLGDTSTVLVVRGSRPDGRPWLPAPPADAYDLVIHGAPAPLAGPAEPWLRPEARTAILVATRGRTRLRDARLTAGLLRHIGVDVSGAVLLPARSRAARRALRAAQGPAPAGLPVLER
jgi:capsular polysaccharide biosynthesis protein